MTALRPGLPVHIDYHRADAPTVVYRQRLVHPAADVVVTLMERTPLPGPKTIGGRTVLEPGSPVVWFTFQGAWHDIGAFHLADGTPTGWYANVLTPVAFADPEPDRWRWSTTDLCLDVWVPREDDDARILDRDELSAAVDVGALSVGLGERASAEAEALLTRARTKEWPPAVVGEWPLERARRVVEESAT